MYQQVTVRSQTSLSLKPLLESAIRGELKTLQYGLKRTEQRLAEFEKVYEMSTTEFKERFETGELEEKLDFIDWWGEIKMLALLQARKQALEGAQVG